MIYGVFFLLFSLVFAQLTKDEKSLSSFKMPFFVVTYNFDSLVHIVWDEKEGVAWYVLEKSIGDGPFWPLAVVPGVHKLSDLMTLNPDDIKEEDRYYRVLYSTEVGWGRFIYNEVYYSEKEGCIDWHFRVKYISLSGDTYITPVQSLSNIWSFNLRCGGNLKLLDKQGRSELEINGSRLGWDESYKSSLKMGIGMPEPTATCPSANNFANTCLTQVGPSQTITGDCCEYTEAPFSGPVSTCQLAGNCCCSGIDCNTFPNASADPCCAHTCAQYNLCGCTPWSCCASVNNQMYVTTSTNYPPLTVSLSKGDAGCGNNGWASANASGGAGGPYNYQWSNGATTSTITGLAPGTYCVTVTGPKNCKASGCVNIAGGSAPVLSAWAQPSHCSTCNGSAHANVSGGTSPYNYTWSNGKNGASIGGLCPGNYSVTVTDGNGCTATASVLVTFYPPPSITVTSSPSRCDNCTGSASVNIAQTNPPYFIYWSNGETSSTITNLCPGNYQVTVEDAYGCSATSIANITNPQITLTTNVNNVSCFGICNGAASASSSGGVLPYSYQWSNGATINSINSLCAGTYSVTATDSWGCTATQSVTITQPPPLTLTSQTTVNPCYGQCFGKIDITPSGGTVPYTYQWSNGAQSEDLNNLCAGTYTLTLKDANNCSITSTYTITEPPQIGGSVSVTTITCAGNCNGFIDVYTFGGVPSYTFLWSNGETTEDLSNICGGNYSLTITDNNGCKTTLSASVSEPLPLTIQSSTITHIKCYGGCNGSISVSVNGGNPPYTYLWSNNQNGSSISGLCAGSYSLTIVDVNGCKITSVFNVTQPGPLTLTSQTTVNPCYGQCFGKIDITPSGGTVPYTYQWSNGAQSEDLNNLCAGTYTLTLKDANNCSVTSTYTITEPPILSLTGQKQDVFCAGQCSGWISVSGTGGTSPYSYQWSNQSNSSFNSQLCAGTYNLTITDANGCQITTSYVITEPPPLTIANTQITTITCNSQCNGSISITPGGGTAPYQYLWSNGATSNNLTGLCSGSYTLMLKDAHNCLITVSYNLPEPPPINTTVAATPTHCNQNEGVVSVSVTGGVPPYTYNWSSNAGIQNGPVASNLPAGTYEVSVIDLNQCIKVVTAEVMNINGPTANAQIINTITCNGSCNGVLQVTATGGFSPYSYIWSNGQTSNIVSGLCAGSYSVTTTDAQGCSFVNYISLPEPPPISVVAYNDTMVCPGNEVVIYAIVSGNQGMPSYYWSNGSTSQSITVTPLSPSCFSVTVSDNKGCSASSNLVCISITPPFSLSVQPSNLTICKGDYVTLTAVPNGTTGKVSYLWSTGDTSQTITVMPIGSYPASNVYSVTATDNCNYAIASSTITFYPPASGTLEVSPIQGCVPLKIQISPKYTQATSCTILLDDTIKFATCSPIDYIFTKPGTYLVSLILSSTYGCSDTLSFHDQIVVYPPPTADFYTIPESPIDVMYPVVNFINTSTPLDSIESYYWIFYKSDNTIYQKSTDKDPIITYPGIPGEYPVMLVVSSNHQCKDTLLKKIVIEGEWTMYIPNVITPNNDGKNDFFIPIGVNFNPSHFEMYIFNRWGELIYETKSVDKPWDGYAHAKDGKELCPEGVYVWIIITSDPLNPDVIHYYRGHVTLLR